MAEALESLATEPRLHYVSLSCAAASGYNDGRPGAPSTETKTMRTRYFSTFSFFLALVALLVVVVRADDYLLYASNGGVAQTLRMPPNVIAMTVEVVG